MLATCQPRISRPNVRSRHTFKKQIISSSYIAVSIDLVPERWGLLSLNPLAGWISPFGSILSLGIRARPEYPRSVSDPLGWTILSPSEENATAKQGYERRSPIAYNLPLGACTPIHAFETCPTRTQPTSLKRGCSIIPQHRVSCRWSTPQKRLPRSSTIVSCRWSTPQRRLPRSLRSCPVGGLRHKGRLPRSSIALRWVDRGVALSGQGRATPTNCSTNWNDRRNANGRQPTIVL